MSSRSWFMTGVLLLAACSDREVGSGPPEANGSEDAPASATDTDDGESATSVAPPPPDDGTSTGTGSSELDDGVDSSSFLCGSPGGDPSTMAHCQPDWNSTPFECDLFAQDCADGDKCTPWAADGGPAWNGTRCTPIAPEPDAVGQPCTVEGNGVSGIDSCALGSMCFGVDPETNEGTCQPHCGGDRSAPTCADPAALCTTANDGALWLCLPGCQPLEGGCGEEEVCVLDPILSAWFCAPAIDPPTAEGEPCEHLNVCGAGQACAYEGLVEGCEGPGCCTQLCDVTAPETCPPEAPQCLIAYPPPHDGPPGAESVGVCTSNDAPDWGGSPFPPTLVTAAPW